MDAMKRSMHISRRDKTRNERMIRKQKWEQKALFLRILRDKQLIWYDHVQRMEDCPNESMTAGTKKRGRPILKWQKSIYKLMSEKINANIRGLPGDEKLG